MRFTPGWAVGWSFVPFMNVFRPYQAMQEIWKICSDPVSWQKQPGSLLIKWWWLFSLLFSLLGGILYRESLHGTFKAQSTDQLKDRILIIIVYECSLFMRL
jgi:hypothetical protein